MRYISSVIVVITGLLIAIFWHALYFENSHQNRDAMLNERVPHFVLPALYPPHRSLDSAIFYHHAKIVLLHVWSSGCSACLKEHALLMRMKQDKHLVIYGILYRDDAKQAMSWLKLHGNPYTMIGEDTAGTVAVDLGIYGTPETFVIGPTGNILYRQIGILTESVWKHVIDPL